MKQFTIKHLSFFALLLCVALFTTSCEKDKSGCTDPLAENYNPDADNDDGSCVINGCNDPLSINFNPDANTDDGSCLSFIGKWDIDEFIFGDDDLIDIGFLKNCEIEFEENNDVVWDYEYLDYNNSIYLAEKSEGTWELDLEDNEIIIEWDPFSTFYTFCGEYNEKVEFDFEGKDEIELTSDNCSSSGSLLLVLER